MAHFKEINAVITEETRGNQSSPVSLNLNDDEELPKFFGQYKGMKQCGKSEN